MTTENTATGDKGGRVQAAAFVIVSVLGVLVVNMVFFRDDPGLLDFNPHPGLLIVLAAIVWHGERTGLATALGLIVGHVLAIVVMADVAILQVILYASYRAPILVLLPAAFVLGPAVRRQLDAARRLQHELREDHAKRAELEAEIQELKDAQVTLAQRVVNARTSLLDILRRTRTGLQGSRDDFYNAAVTLVCDYTGAQAAAIWRVGGNSVTLRCWHGPKPELAPRIDQRVLELLGEHRVLSLADLPDDVDTARLPLVMGAIGPSREGRPRLILAIHQISFSQLSAEALRILRATCDWSAAMLELRSGGSGTSTGERKTVSAATPESCSVRDANNRSTGAPTALCSTATAGDRSVSQPPNHIRLVPGGMQSQSRGKAPAPPARRPPPIKGRGTSHGEGIVGRASDAESAWNIHRSGDDATKGFRLPLGTPRRRPM